MKELHICFILLFFSFSSNAQLSIFSELAGSPFVSSGENVSRNLKLGLSFNIQKQTALRAGLSAFDLRNGESKTAFVDVFVPGLVISFDNCALNHQFDLNATSAFLGLQQDFGKFRLVADFHRVFGKLQDSYIAVDESYLFVTNPGVRYFESKYSDVRFNKLHLELGYEIIKREKGSFYIIGRYAQDFLNTENALIVESYDSELLPYLSSLPGSNTISVMEFLQGGDLIYKKNNFYFGVQINYVLISAPKKA